MGKSRQQFESWRSNNKSSTINLFNVWQASRESLDVELPKRKNICDNEFEDCFYDGVDKCREILLDNGVKVK